MNTTILASVSAAIGILVGGFGMWRTLKTDIEKKVEIEVTERVTTATKFARYDERLKAIDARLEIQEKWQLLQTERLNAAFQAISRKQDSIKE
jgi:hypothetical protein